MERQVSEDNLRRLIDQVKTDLGVVPFVGAGISASVGYPGWTGFLLQQAEQFQRKAEIAEQLASGKYEDAAEALSEMQGPRAFADAIEAAFGSHRLPRRRINAAAKWLPRIAAGPVITTNFDRVLETCFIQAETPFDACIYGARYDRAARALIENRRFLLKIHGDVEDRQDRVLTRAEYDQCYGPTTTGNQGEFPLGRLLRQIWQSRAILFVGCSLTSDRTMHVLRQLAEERPELFLYAILEAPSDAQALPERARFLSERGIRPIWYAAGQHENVEQILRQLATSRERADKSRRAGSRTAAAGKKPSAASEAKSVAPEALATRKKSKIYISCSWQLHGLRTEASNQISAVGHQPLFDEGWDPSAIALSKAAVATLREAHILVTLLTVESLQHPHVRAELERADGLAVKICAVVEESACPLLPWFVSGAATIDNCDPGTLLAALRAHTDALRDDQLSEYESMALARSQISSIFRIWRREAVGSSNRQWQLGLARQIVDNAAQELDSLNKHQFESFVGRGHNFLLRALPVFERAERVCAVSIDSVSNFWVSGDRTDQQMARKYWHAQPKNAQRLFVFSSPESAHNYATILNIHARKYGQTGRVYLCSLTSYIRFAAAAGLPGTSHQHAHCDYAALDYDSGTGSVTYVASLDAERFHVFKEPDRELARQMDEFKSGMLALEGLVPGQVDPETTIMRWQVDLQNDPRTWAARLQALFGQRRPDICHLVFVARSAMEAHGVEERLRAVVSEVRNTLAELQESQTNKVRLKDFWVGNAHNVPARDAHFDGRIKSGDAGDYPLMLMMRFEDEDALLRWYGEKTHSTLRRTLYELVDSSVARLFDRAASSSAQEAATIYEHIEEEVSALVTRRDYLEANAVEDIVRRRPFRPPIKFE